MLTTRRFLLVTLAAGLAGCAVKPIVLDRESLSGIKRVALPTIGIPETPSVQVLNPVSARLGLIGLIAGATVENNRRAALKAMVAANGLDPAALLESDLVSRLRKQNLAVVAGQADRGRQAFLANYGRDAGHDAVLDVVVNRFGFIALSDADQDFYRPTVALEVRLVSGRDGSVLMQDNIHISGVPGEVLSETGQPMGNPSFPTFTEIEANPVRAIRSLRMALAVAADGIAKRIA